jgi:hypothetical protein
MTHLQTMSPAIANVQLPYCWVVCIAMSGLHSVPVSWMQVDISDQLQGTSFKEFAP